MAKIYDSKLKEQARTLRKAMTVPEVILWTRLRRKQILGVKFLRQKLLGQFILDFYAPQIKLAIELDGSQHYDAAAIIKDRERDCAISRLCVLILRYPNHEIIHNLNAVLEDIYFEVRNRI